MKKIFFLIFAFVSTFVLMLNSSCDLQPTTDQVMNSKQEQMSAELNARTGMPAVNNAAMKSQLKSIIEECDRQDLICYCYIVAEFSGELKFMGKCIGYGMPYSTQFTSPSKVQNANDHGGYTSVVIPQADPDGLFKPASADGTWVMLINPKDTTRKAHPVFFEPKVIISPFPLK